MKKTLTLALLVVLVGCGVLMQTYDVADVTKAEIITLEKKSTQGHIHGITVIGKGHIDGDAEIVLLLSGTPYKTETLSGDVDFTWGGDWYSDSAKVEYKPSSVKSGHLSLQYAFED